MTTKRVGLKARMLLTIQEAADPQQLFDARYMRRACPGFADTSYSGTLAALCQEGHLVRVGTGLYRRPGPGVMRDGSVPEVDDLAYVDGTLVLIIDGELYKAVKV